MILGDVCLHVIFYDDLFLCNSSFKYRISPNANISDPIYSMYVSRYLSIQS